MPPALNTRQTQSLISSTSMLTLAAAVSALLLAGCQSHSTQDDDMRLSHRTDGRQYFNYEPSATGNWTGQKPSPLAHQHQDIWARIRTGFQLQEVSHVRIEQHKKRFINNPSTLQTVSKRSAPYIHYIVERLEEQHMPLELALLPIIESSYNPFAYSSAQAVGLWQFVPSTGQYYNLRQTRWYDGRRDVTASTNAALRYLSYLHDFFNGDWLLAIAAYNAGEGTVSKAIEANQRQGLPTDYWNLPLPQETRDYVPKLLAVSQLVLHPQNYGVSLAPVANEPYFEVVRLNRRVNLAHAAKLAELEEEELYRLNPAFTKGITVDGPKHLLVPAQKAAILASNLARWDKEFPAADAPDDLPEPTLNWDIPKRMAATRYNTSNQTREINKAIAREIMSAQALNDQNRRQQLTRVEHVLSPVGTQVSQISGSSIQIHLQTPSLEKREQANNAPRTYKVKPGDNLQQIAKNFKISIGDLKNWNSSIASHLKPGQVLTLQPPISKNAVKQTAEKNTGKPGSPTSSTNVAKLAKSAASSSVAVTEGKNQLKIKSPKTTATVYKVKKGESIQQIAKRFNVQPKALQNWNPDVRQELKPGQMLTLYLP